MAQSQATKRVTRKGSKQLTDKERASQVASLTRSPSLTIPPGEIDEPIIRDPATLTEAGRRSQAFARQMKADDIKRAERAEGPTPEAKRGSPFFTPEIMQGVREAQEKRAKMTP